jgi:hypothetical protein
MIVPALWAAYLSRPATAFLLLSRRLLGTANATPVALATCSLTPQHPSTRAFNTRTNFTFASSRFVVFCQKTTYRDFRLRIAFPFVLELIVNQDVVRSFLFVLPSGGDASSPRATEEDGAGSQGINVPATFVGRNV